MDRNEAIKIISLLYPTNSVYQKTNDIGKELLKKARRFVNEPDRWQNESTEVLIKYAEFCQEYEYKEHKKLTACPLLKSRET